ncbi:hypothetical protein GmHk_09G025541 [Glycine max]|nr:hypothetical protein GmHk_09G025541 [Glycine max]
MKLHEFLWKSYTTNVMSALPPICLVGRCPSQPLNIHGITLKGKQDENWEQLFTPMIGQWNKQVDFRVDGYPRQEVLLNFNSNYTIFGISKKQRCLLTKKMQTQLH